MTEASLPVVRKIANLERYSIARSNANVYHNVLVGARLSPRDDLSSQLQSLEGWLSILAAPLTWLLLEHPSLSIVIGNHLSSSPVFLKLPSVNLARVVRFRTINHRDEITKILKDEHAEKYDLADHSVPLWRVVIVHVKTDNTFFVLYNFHHTIGDGRCAVGLTEQLFDRLNIEDANETKTKDNHTTPLVVSVPQEAPIPLPLESLINCDPTAWTMIKELAMILLLPSPVKKALEKKYWAGDIDASNEVPHDTEVDMWYLTKEETKQVVQAAKANSTTVQGLLFSASCFAIKASYLSSKGNSASTEKGNSNAGSNTYEFSTTKDSLVFSTPISLRPLLTPPVGLCEMGCLTAQTLTKDVRIGLETPIWEMARNYRERIIKKTQTPKGLNSMLQHIGLLKYLPSKPGGWEDWLRDQDKKEQHGREATLMLSNVGQAWTQKRPTTDEQTRYRFQVEDPIFTQSAMPSTGLFSLSAATANGVLSVTGTWQKSSFKSRDAAELFMREFKRIMLEASTAGAGYHFVDALKNSEVYLNHSSV